MQIILRHSTDEKNQSLGKYSDFNQGANLLSQRAWDPSSCPGPSPSLFSSPSYYIQEFNLHLCDTHSVIQSKSIKHMQYAESALSAQDTPVNKVDLVPDLLKLTV